MSGRLGATTWALIAFPLAVLIVLGEQVFRGISYTFAFNPEAGFRRAADYAPAPSQTYLLVGGFLTALFCLLPVVVGFLGLKRVVSTDPAWVSAMLRAAVALGALSFLLRLVIAVLITVSASGDSAV